MRTRLIVLFIFVMSTALGTTPAQAQGAYVEVEFGRAAFAFWEDVANERFAYILAGQGALYNSDLGEPFVGEIGCAAAGTAKSAAFGCGPLSAFAIADDLGTASGKGTFDTLVFDHKSGKVTRKGRISFAGTWKATSDVFPQGSGGFFFEGGFVGSYVATAPIRRDAHGGIKGGVTRSPVGGIPKGPASGGAILLGADITVDLHG